MSAAKKHAAAAAKPAPSVAPVCWFPSLDDVTRLPLPGGQWIEVKPELESGEFAAIFDGMSDDAVDANMAAGLELYRLRRAATYLQAWSLVPALDREDREKRLEVLRRLRASRFEALYKAISAHDAALPAPPPIIPVDVALSDAWFLGPDDTLVLALPGNESVTIRAELEAGEQAKILAGLDVRKNGQVSAIALAHQRVTAYVVSWTLTYPTGKPVPVGLDSLRAMKASYFGVLNRTIQAYEKALETRAENPTGADGSKTPSA